MRKQNTINSDNQYNFQIPTSGRSKQRYIDNKLIIWDERLHVYPHHIPLKSPDRVKASLNISLLFLTIIHQLVTFSILMASWYNLHLGLPNFLLPIVYFPFITVHYLNIAYPLNLATLISLTISSFHKDDIAPYYILAFIPL